MNKAVASNMISSSFFHFITHMVLKCIYVYLNIYLKKIYPLSLFKEWEEKGQKMKKKKV